MDDDDIGAPVPEEVAHRLLNVVHVELDAGGDLLVEKGDVELDKEHFIEPVDKMGAVNGINLLA